MLETACTHIEHERSRARCPLLVNVMMCAGRSATAESFFFRGRRKASTSAPVIVPRRAVIALIISRGEMEGVCVWIRGSKAI